MLSGNVTELRLYRPSKALLPTKVTPSSTTTVVMAWRISTFLNQGASTHSLSAQP